MTNEEISALKELISKPGWKIYQSILKYRYDQDNSKWRLVLAKERKLDKLAGYLDGLQYAINIAQQEIDSDERWQGLQPTE